MHFVNIKGKRRKVRVNAKGQWRFMKMGSTTSRTRRSGSSRSRRRGVRRLVRRRRGKRKRRGPRTIPILPLAGFVAGVAEPIQYAIDGNPAMGLHRLLEQTTGFGVTIAGQGAQHGFVLEDAKKFWVPVIVGAIGHKLANMTGINRVFSRLPAPLNKLRL